MHLTETARKNPDHSHLAAQLHRRPDAVVRCRLGGALCRAGPAPTRSSSSGRPAPFTSCWRPVISSSTPRTQTISLLLIAKTTAFVFLIGGSLLVETPWSVWFSGFADGAMALTAYLVHRAVEGTDE